MSTRVQRHRQADAARRRVRTVGTHRIGQRTVIRKPKQRRAKYRKSAALAGLSTMFSAFSFMTGSIFWAVGACAGAAGSAVAWRIEYRRELAQVKATGKPVGTPVPKQPVTRTARKPNAKPVDDHLARCKAKPPGGPTCRCPDGPNRKPKTSAKRKT